MELLTALINKLSPLPETMFKNLTAPATEAANQSQVVTKDAVTGVMVALFPDKTTSQTIYDFCVENAGLAADSVTPADMLHITLAYLGNTIELAERKWSSPREIAEKLEYNFSQYELPIVGKTTGIALFDAVEITSDTTGLTEKKRPLVLLFDSSQLPHFRHELTECLEEDCGIELNDKHGFIPHITLCYLPEDATIPDAFYGFPQQSMLFTNAVLAWGAARFDLPLLGKTETEMDSDSGMAVMANTMPEYNSFSVKELADGSWRWVAFTASSFIDRDGEIVSQKALEEDVARSKIDGDYGPLLWWHVDEYVLGQCDYSEMCGSILVESGTFSTPQIAKAISRIANDLGMSQSFKGIRDLKLPIMFIKARKKERSMLPEVKASNELTETGVLVNKGGLPEMKLHDLVNRFVASGMPLEEATQVVAQVATRAAEKEQKAIADGLVQKESPAATAEPTPAPAGLSLETVKEVLTEFSSQMLQTVSSLVDSKLAEQATKETALATTVNETNKATSDLLATIKASVDSMANRLSALEGEQPANVTKQLLGQWIAGSRPASQSNANLVNNPAEIEALKAAQLSPEEQLANSNPIYKMAQDLAKGFRG